MHDETEFGFCSGGCREEYADMISGIVSQGIDPEVLIQGAKDLYQNDLCARCTKPIPEQSARPCLPTSSPSSSNRPVI